MPSESTAHAYSQQSQCPRCDAPLQRGQSRCWLCGADVSDADRERLAAVLENFYARPKTTVPRLSFSFAALLMFVTIISLMLGVSTIAAGIGIPVGLIVLGLWVPAALRAIAPRSPSGARPIMGPIDSTLLLLGVVGVVALGAMLFFLVTVAAAMVATCGKPPGM